MKRFAKLGFFLFLFLAVYYAFVWLVLPFFIHPRFQKFDNYIYMENWDLGSHGVGDFDEDGSQDMIALGGCAFLSSVSESSIPEEKQCVAPTMIVGVFEDTNKIGQRYILSTDPEEAVYDTGAVKHSYAVKRDGKWYIVARLDEGLKSFEVVNGGLLKEVSVGFLQKVDEFFYFTSSLFVILAVPLIPVFAVFSPFPESIYPDPTLQTGILLMVSMFCYLIWRKTKTKKKKLTSHLHTR